MLCTPCPWNTTCPCGVQQMTGPSCVVSPAWVSLHLSPSSSVSNPLPPATLGSVRTSPHVSRARPIRVVPPCLDTGMDLTGIFSPPDIRLATKIGETEGDRGESCAWAAGRYGCEDHADDLLDLSITGGPGQAAGEAIQLTLLGADCCLQRTCSWDRLGRYLHRSVDRN